MANYSPYLYLLAGFVMLCLVQAQDECLELDMSRPRMCYECISYILAKNVNHNSSNNFCGTPFNTSHSNVVLAVCEGYCFKWERDVGPGVIRYQRGCTKSITIRMRLQEMCVSESRPRSGEICFCNENKCNSGKNNSMDKYTTMLLLFLTFLYYKHWLQSFDERG